MYRPVATRSQSSRAFVNLYRLLRARLEYPIAGEPSLSRYLDDQEYKIALLMLALQVGCPRDGRTLVSALEVTQRQDRSEGRHASDPTVDAALERLAPDDAPQKIERHVLECLKGLRARDLIPNDILPYITWSNRVARFSFQPWQA